MSSNLNFFLRNDGTYYLGIYISLLSQNLVTLTELVVATIQSSSVQILGQRALQARCEMDRLLCELWDMFGIAAKGSTNRHKVLADCGPSTPDIQGTRIVHRYSEAPFVYLDIVYPMLLTTILRRETICLLQAVSIKSRSMQVRYWETDRYCFK